MSRAKEIMEKVRESLAYPLTFGDERSTGTGYPLSFSSDRRTGEGTRIKNSQSHDSENPVFDPDDPNEEISLGIRAEQDDFE